MTSNTKLRKKYVSIKLVISDVDGVLTDGGMYYSENGEVMKKFNTKDGMGMELLSNKGIKTILISKENSKIVKARAKKLSVSKVFLGIYNKELLLPEICKKFQVSKNEICYIGDDINDLEIMNNVGFSACPMNAISTIKDMADYISNYSGGDGVFRDIAELILSSKK
jgi:N-acylneuraminate cytidylyltransferase